MAMSALATCSKCGDLFSAESGSCPTCRYPRTGDEAIVMRGASAPKVPTSVVVTDFDMPFGSMVSFMVRWAIAAIPAVIILFVIFAVLGSVMGGFLMSIFR
jgi:hypothetical protein